MEHNWRLSKSESGKIYRHCGPLRFNEKRFGYFVASDKVTAPPAWGETELKIITQFPLNHQSKDYILKKFGLSNKARAFGAKRN